ncbi:PKD-like family lipoprotein [Filimonas effusa]|uniref:PKD family protein n=1 Tax=Filimonas effusa TaxID=2508721 RepID=A0A4Q1DBR1_9BACT|nr:PKD-like family lipoprotein [Filimonas effusa]RXK86901.1 hypothetical protein ESB13_08955 [Filimonas effusa]
MKKIYAIILPGLAMILFLASCYKDKGNYSYKQQMPLAVDTAGKTNTFSVQKSVTVLSIDPKVVFEEDPARLKYLWRIYGTSTINTVADTLSRNRQFSQPVEKTPGNYWLELQVTDTVTSIKAVMQYAVTVTSPYPYGWMVLYEKEGNSEIGLLRTSDIISGLSKDTVLLDAFETINKHKLTGLPLFIQQSGRMWFTNNTAGFSNNYVIYAITASGGAMMDYVSFDYLTDYNGMFLSKPAVIKPGGIEGAIGMIANDRKIYSTYLISPYFTGPALEPNKGYEVDATSFVATDYNVYDQKNMRFLIMSGSDPFLTEFQPANAPAALFDLSNIGKVLQFQQNGYNSYRYAFFKDPSGNGRYLYTISFAGQNSNPRNPSIAKIDLTAAPGIQDAGFFAVSDRGPVAFYANAGAVYKTSTLTNSAELAFDRFGAGEVITSMKLFKAVGSGYTSATTRNSQLMFVSTWNQASKQGFVYVITVNEVSGQMNTASFKKFGGFGKIADMSLKAN